jgi:hypothetical protein
MYEKIDTSLKQRAKDRIIVLNNLKPCTGKQSYHQLREKRRACARHAIRMYIDKVTIQVLKGH